MRSPESDHDEQLLAYHMGWLDRADMARLERLMADSPVVAARARELERHLAPLADWDALPACDDLDRHILRQTSERVDTAEHRRAISGQGSPTGLSIADGVRLDPVPAPRGRVLSFPLTAREVIAASIAMFLLSAVVVPSFARVMSEANRRRCADNLQHIGQAFSSYYSQEQHLPFAGSTEDAHRPATNWLRERTPGIPRFRNSQNRFLLARTGYLGDTSHYVCPSDQDAIIMRVDDAADFDDFAEHRNDSYNSQLPLGAAVRGVAPEMVVYADPNPIFDPRAAVDPGAGMSLAHAGLGGQNVLRLDAAVAWATTPHVGVANDDIWRLGRRSNYNGSEIPQLATDSFMIP